jgi:lipopolysaccharide heptosyltransferase I
MKILIIKLSSIGDVIHTLPVLSAIKKELPNAEIDWIVEKKSAEILRNNPLINKIIEVDTKSLRKKDDFGKNLSLAKQSLRELRETKYDITLDFQGLFKSAAIAKLARTKKRIGFDKESLREPGSRFLLSETFPVEAEKNIVRKNLSLAAKALKIRVPDEDFDFLIFTEEKHRAEAEKIIDKADRKFAILNPATSWVTKLWSAEKYGQLADKLWEEQGLVSIVTTAQDEKDIAEEVIKNSKSGKIFSSTPSLKGFYELAKRAEIYVGGDTGPLFLAVAANCPIVGIFGPTEWWRNGSPNENDIGVERMDINCRIDCHRRTCSNWICMNIEVESVFQAVKKRMSLKSQVSKV